MLLSESGADYLDQWCHDKNDITPSDISDGSGKKVWWRCPEGHTWQASPEYRKRGFGKCPTCRSFGYRHPDLLEEWDYDKNTLDPFVLKSGSGRSVHWKCREGHTWETVINNRVKDRQGCPYCAGQRRVVGVNDLSTTHPRLARQWDHEKNDVTIEDVGHGSKVARWWTDECGHSWKMSPLHRTKLSDLSCPVCRTIPVVFPEWVEQWHEDNELSVNEATTGTDALVKWRHPDCGHVWEQVVCTRYISVDRLSCPYCSGVRVLSGFNDLATLRPELVSQWHEDNDISPNEVSRGSGMKALWKCDNGHVWRALISDRSNGSGCPRCAKSISNMETELNNIITSWGVVTTTNRRDIIRPRELDIYIPEKKIAVEFNGVYWHSDKYLDKNYHYDKWRMCHDQGIQLITVWEDDWIRKRDVVLSMLKHKLGVSTSPTIMARKTSAVPVNRREAQSFLDSHHIQGYSTGSTSIGLMFDNELVAVSSWRKVEETLYLDRYATSCVVVGGMGKLLKAGHGMARDRGCTEIVTFADHQVSDGGLYEKLGFRKAGELKPDYQYLVANRRVHKFNYRLSRFRDDDDLVYDENMTESELASINGLCRIWDCGKSRYVVDVT